MIKSTSMVRVQFASNLDLYLSLYNYTTTTKTEPSFVATSKHRLKTLNNFCGKAALRQIDTNIFEFYFCGYKMCLANGPDDYVYNSSLYKSNEDDKNGEGPILTICMNDEHNTKWELEKVDKGRTYLIRNNNYCITLREGRVVLEECHDGVYLEQIVHVIPEYGKPRFLVTDDVETSKRKKTFENHLDDNQEMYRMASMAYGREFGDDNKGWDVYYGNYMI